jgi:hypothetical protein
VLEAVVLSVHIVSHQILLSIGSRLKSVTSQTSLTQHQKHKGPEPPETYSQTSLSDLRCCETQRPSLSGATFLDCYEGKSRPSIRV